MHVIATAGHVDHGKSALVRALTGMEPDRWAEERRRGMTIDLGYAWTSLPGRPADELLAFVDVPGHQRFIGNMLAGLGPAPAVLLVVAADEGWREQSAEHLAAVDALDVRHGGISTGYSCLSPSGSQPRESGRQLPPEPKTLARTGIMASTQSTSESGT
jgi:selenocysteine-specific elongation factor